MKNFFFLNFVFLFFITNILVAQDINTPTDNGGSIKDSSTNTSDSEAQTDDFESIIEENIASTNLPNQENPSLNSVMDKGKSYLIQLNPKQSELQKDPFPLESYKGPFIKDINQIQKQFQLKNIALVKASLEKWVQEDQVNFPILGYLLLGNIYDTLKMYDKSIEVYNQAQSLELKEKEKIAFDINKSQVLRHWNKPKESLEILNGVKQEYYKIYPQVFLYKSLALLYLKNTDEAVVNLRKYLEYAPKNKQLNNIKRAIAWILLSNNQSGDYPSSKGSTSAEREQEKQNTERIIQLLMENQLIAQEEDLLKQSKSSVKDKNLSIEQQGLQEGDSFDFIAD